MGPFPVSEEVYSLLLSTSNRPLEDGLSRWEVGNRSLLFPGWEAKATSPLLGAGVCLGGAGDAWETSQAEKWVDLPQQERAHTVSLHIISCIISIGLYLAKSRYSTQLCPEAAFICLTVPCSAQGSQAGLPDLGSFTGIWISCRWTDLTQLLPTCEVWAFSLPHVFFPSWSLAGCWAIGWELGKVCGGQVSGLALEPLQPVSSRELVLLQCCCLKLCRKKIQIQMDSKWEIQMQCVH